MKINITPIVKGIRLSEYDERMAPAEVLVWVNPTRGFLQVRTDAIKSLPAPTLPSPKLEEERPNLGEGRFEEFNTLMFGWYAELWSKGVAAETHWTAEEVQALNEQDPTLFTWLMQRSAQLMNERRLVEKKS